MFRLLLQVFILCLQSGCYFYGRKAKNKKSIWNFHCPYTYFRNDYFAVASVIPSLITQLTSLINATGKAYPQIRTWIEGLQHNPRFSHIYEQLDIKSLVERLNLSYTDILHNLLNSITISVGSIVSIITSIIMVMILVPILLYYMLKDGEKLFHS